MTRPFDPAIRDDRRQQWPLPGSLAIQQLASAVSNPRNPLTLDQVDPAIRRDVEIAISKIRNAKGNRR